MPENFEDPKAWIPETTDRQGRERGLVAYEGYLGFKREELEGKDVLDLGSGETERFSRELKEAGINASVVPLNPDYSIERFREKIKETPGWQRKSVAAIAQELPFKDRAFDKVFGLYSVTVFSMPGLYGAPKAARMWMSEIVRVLKPGGEIRLAPVGSFAANEKEVKRGRYRELISDLERRGLEVKIEMIKNKELGYTTSTSYRMDKDGQEHEETRNVGEIAMMARLVIKKPTNGN